MIVCSLFHIANERFISIIGKYWVSVLLMCESGTALIFCPLFGYLVDGARTRKFPFLAALIILAGCMAILHVSHSIVMFVIGRLLQGCAGALVVVAAFALLNDSVPQERLGQTIGYLGSAIASGFLLGPFMGGVVYHAGGYDAVFYVAYFIIAVDMAMRVSMVEKKVAEKWDRSSSSEEVEGNARAESSTACEVEAVPKAKRFVMFKILRQRRVLISSWALLVQGIFLSAFDAVCLPRAECSNDSKIDKITDIIYLR
jgi:MFS family permease